MQRRTFTLAKEICLRVGFAADVGRCHAKGIPAARISWTHPSEHSLFEQPQNRSPVLENDTQPRRLPHHREIDSAKTKTREKNIEAIPDMRVFQRPKGGGESFRAIEV